MKSAGILAFLCAALLLGGCGVIPVTVEQVDRTLDCYFLPIDHPVADCKADGINAANVLAASLTGSLYYQSGYDPAREKEGLANSCDEKKSADTSQIKKALECWESIRSGFYTLDKGKTINLDEEQKIRLRVLRGYYVYAYLLRVAKNEAQRNSADGRDVAIRTHAHFKRGLANIEEVIDGEDNITAETKYFGHTRKMEIFFDGFEAVYETKLATATRVVKFFRSIGDTVDPLSAIERIRLGARFAFDQATLRVYANALQLDLIQTAVAIHKSGESKENWKKALSVVRNDITDSCKDLGSLAGLPKGDSRLCVKADTTQK